MVDFRKTQVHLYKSSQAAASQTRAFFFHRSWVAAALAATGAIALLSVILLHHWQALHLLVLSIATGVAAVNAAVRLLLSERMPRWTLNVDVAAGNLFASIAVAAAAREHIILANLYLLVAFFAFLYLRIAEALMHLALAGLEYAVILHFVTHPLESPVIAWLSVFGTAIVLGAVAIGLVSVLRMSATEDPLTGLANRRLWDERLEEELERAKRSGDSLSVIIIDIDHFKSVNDTKGHEAGDRLLSEIAASLSRAIRGSGDFLARIGGDEFAVLAPGSAEISARSIVNRLAGTLPEGISASFGFASWDSVESATELVHRADQDMYQSKRRRSGHSSRPA